MEKWRERIEAAGVFCVLLLVLALSMRRTMVRTAHITLPDTGAGAAEFHREDRYALVEVNPRTVRAAAAALQRPDSYRRDLTITWYWEGGSGSCKAASTVYLPWTRIDLTLPDGRVRHVLTNEEEVCVWYDGETAVYRGAAAGLSADAEQWIPRWEDVLDLNAESIRAADYRLLGGVPCIYVDTVELSGQERRYWVSVNDGLLAAAEWLEEGRTVYQMEASPAESWEPDPAPFTLPDGTMVTPVP